MKLSTATVMHARAGWAGMRRALALAPTVAAFALAAWVVRVGHPMGIPFALLAAAAAVLAGSGRAFATMALGVVASIVGTLFGLSMGWWGIGIGALVTLAGAVSPGPPVVRLGAVAAVLVAPALAVAASARGWTGMVYVGAMLPGIVWFLLDAWRRREPRAPT